MNKQQNNTIHVIIGSEPFHKYVKMNDHFFSYYTKDPLNNKRCRDCFKFLLLSYHVSSIIYIFVNYMQSMNSKQQYKDSYSEEKYDSSQEETYFYFGVFGLFGCFMMLYIIILSIRFCLNRITEYLRIDIIYSKNFDRLFIGIVKNNGKEYLKKFLFN